MGVYEFIDQLSMRIGGAVAKNSKYFSKSVESKTISEYINCLEIKPLTFDGEGYYPVDIRGRNVTMVAAFQINQWKGKEYPTIIYHHGAAEGAYDYSFKNILGKSKNLINANLIAIQAPFNHSNKEYMDSIAYLSNYTAMLAGSALLIEGIITELRRNGAAKIVVAGTSLGGFVTNLHFTYFQSADCYKPLLAGANLGDVFIKSAYTMVTSENGKSNPDVLNKVLNFDNDLQKRDQYNLFPLLGKNDQIIRYNVQKMAYSTKNLKVVPYGHATGATKFKMLRQHILEGMNI